jgi:SAM-dependent methyltransferase
MPYSAEEGKAQIREWVTELRPKSVLDIGPGAGTYAKLLDGLGIERFTCVEIFEPYVERFQLRQLYDEVIVGDARRLRYPDVDLVIFGDVLEHMTQREAQLCWREAESCARLGAIISIPVIPYPQGECEGNAHEAHLVTWTHEMVLASFEWITESHTYTEIGIYRAEFPHD